MEFMSARVKMGIIDSVFKSGKEDSPLFSNPIEEKQMQSERGTKS
jgi:hypothetical protein